MIGAIFMKLGLAPAMRSMRFIMLFGLLGFRSGGRYFGYSCSLMFRLVWPNVRTPDELLSLFGLHGQQGSDLPPVLRLPQKAGSGIAEC